MQLQKLKPETNDMMQSAISHFAIIIPSPMTSGPTAIGMTNQKE